MLLCSIHECLSDPTRLRILHLLTKGPLCVCHVQELLDESQVKISKHLAYLRKREVVEARRDANWMIYSLPKRPAPLLTMQLDCLKASARHESILKKDAARLSKLDLQGSPCGCSM